jgi:hypothetical protein
VVSQATRFWKALPCTPEDKEPPTFLVLGQRATSFLSVNINKVLTWTLRNPRDPLLRTPALVWWSKDLHGCLFTLFACLNDFTFYHREINAFITSCSWVWKCTPVIPALGKAGVMQEDCSKQNKTKQSKTPVHHAFPCRGS